MADTLKPFCLCVCIYFWWLTMLLWWDLLLVSVHFKPANTLRRKLVHPKDKTPRHKQNNIVYNVPCSQDCTDMCIGETKQPLGQDSAVHLHLKDKKHSIEDNNVNILSREDRWFQRGIKESIYVTLWWHSVMIIFEQRRWPMTSLITHLECSAVFPPQAA